MKSSATFHCTAVLLLALLALLAGGAARRESATIDEIAHTAAGVSYLQKLDLRMNEEHPPLAKVLAALPLVLRGTHADYSHISWTFSAKIFHQYLGEWIFGDWLVLRWNDPHSTMLWARAPMLLLTLALGVAIYLCAADLGGPWAGLLCLSAFVTTPAFLTFGPLVLTDTAITLFWLLTVWQLPNMWRSPAGATRLTFSLALAGALLSKFSAGLLFVDFAAYALSLRLHPLPGQPPNHDKVELRRWRRRAWRNLAQATLCAAFLVYLAYLVLSWHQPTDSFDIIPHFPGSPWLRRLLMPIWLYLRGLLGFAFSAGSRPTFILGHHYPHGVWFYFPLLFLLKSQLSFLLLMVLAGAIALLAKRCDPTQSPIPTVMQPHWRSLSISLAVFVAACMLNRLDLSIRHFLIALALIILLLAPLPRALQLMRQFHPQTARVGNCLVIVLALASIVTAVRAYPTYLPYLNSLSLGRPGYHLVNDSNLDWNHALPAVETFVQQHDLQQILLAEYGFSDPEPYIPQAHLWDCQQPAPQDGGHWAAVSANYIEESGNCLWLLRYPHQVLAGGSMYIVQLPPIIPGAGVAGGPPLPADYQYFAGLHPEGFDPRAVFVNCIRDPKQLQPTWDRMQAMMENAKKK